MSYQCEGFQKTEETAHERKRHYLRKCYLGLAVLVIVALSYLALRQPADKPAGACRRWPENNCAAWPSTSKEWMGDFDKMLEYRRNTGYSCRTVERFTLTTRAESEV